MTEKKLTHRLRAMFTSSQITVGYDEFTRNVIAVTLCRENQANNARFAADWKLSDKSVLITRTL